MTKQQLLDILNKIKKAVDDESNRDYDDDGNFCIIDGNYIADILNDIESE